MLPEESTTLDHGALKNTNPVPYFIQKIPTSSNNPQQTKSVIDARNLVLTKPSTAINIKQKRQKKASSCFLAIKITTFMFPTNGHNHKIFLIIDGRLCLANH